MDRQITYTVRASHLNSGPDRFITHIGGPWGLAAEEDAIRDIRYGFHTYYVLYKGERVEAKIAKGVIRNYLVTCDDVSSDVLLSLPQPFTTSESDSASGGRGDSVIIRLAEASRSAA